ncbi:hypothetical protein QE152_g24645 [Popillia japonica]|uniref:FBD domain-containing protein n=1 Tax=Popillia japonica TaxID=7064 RepID=A0AAW1K4K6_POPJA
MITKGDDWELYDFKKLHVILKSHIGTIKTLGDDWELYDFKKLHVILKKYPEISQMKRFIIKNSGLGENAVVKISVEVFYRTDDHSKLLDSLLKRALRGKKLSTANLSPLALGKTVKADKIASIMALLRAVDENWEKVEKFSWYATLLTDENEKADQRSEEDVCDCNEEDCGLRI